MKIKDNEKRIHAIACLIITVVLVVSATVGALPNEHHSNQIRNDGYIIVIENSTAYPGDTGHLIEVNGSWEEEIFAYCVRINYGPLSEDDDINITDINLDGCVGEGAPHFAWEVTTDGQYGSISALLMTGLVEPGEGIPAGEGKLINIITDIAPSAVPQVIPIYNNQTSESFYWNLSLFVNTTVIDGQLEITEEQPEEPELVITSIRGGLGLEIIVENHGLIDATEIKVNITVSGGFWILKRNFEEKIDTLSPDGDQFVVRKIIIGFGLGILKNRPKIQISATCAEDKPVETTIEVRALIVFLLILDQ